MTFFQKAILKPGINSKAFQTADNSIEKSRFRKFGYALASPLHGLLVVRGVAHFPQTNAEFAECFLHDEAACLEFLEAVRWPNGPRCPLCQHDEVLTMEPPYYRCKNEGCGGYDFTVRSKTLFAATHLRLQLWFQAIWHFASQKNGTSAVQLEQVLRLGSNRTALRMLKVLKTATESAIRSSSRPVSEL